MEFLDSLRDVVAHTWVIVAVIAVLIAYRYASSKTDRLPTIPLGLLILYLISRLIIRTLPETDLIPNFYKWLEVISLILLYCAIVRLFFALFVDYWYQWRNKRPLPKITRDVLLIIIYAIITLIVLRTRGGVNPLGLITTSAVLTAVVGLAAQNSLGNLFAGLSIQLERPYRIGDWIQYDDFVGQVIGIGWKSTRIRTFEKELLFIPNLDIIKNVVKNFSRPTQQHMMTIDIGVEYGAPPNKVRNILMEICRDDSRISKHPAPHVRTMDYGDFAITYQLRFVYNDYGLNPQLKSDITNRIWYAFRRNGVRIPFPIRDVHHRHIERKHEELELKILRQCARRNLDELSIFSPLAPKQLDSLAQNMEIEDFCDGEEIVRQGDSGDSLYIIHSGICDVFMRAGGIKPLLVATMLNQEYFGEMSLLTGAPRSATVKARGDTRVFKIDKAQMAEIIESHPAISEELAQALAKRHGELEILQGKQREDEAKNASKFLSKIKSFFSI